MLKKKIIATAAACVLMFSLSTISAMAGAGHHSRTVSYPICPVEDCEIAMTHQHDQNTYCGHSLNDGHDFHRSCSQTDCTSSEVHEHDGHYYFGHCADDTAATGSGDSAIACSDFSRAGRGHHGRHHSGGHH